MNHHKLQTAFLIFYSTLGLVVFGQSINAALQAVGHNPHLVILASIEALAALLFLFPFTMRIGGGLLLATFIIAFAAHSLNGELVGSLIVYGVAVLFVMIHGPIHRPEVTPRPFESST